MEEDKKEGETYKFNLLNLEKLSTFIHSCKNSLNFSEEIHFLFICHEYTFVIDHMFKYINTHLSLIYYQCVEYIWDVSLFRIDNWRIIQDLSTCHQVF